MLFTPDQLERIRRIILRYHAAIVLSTFGADALPEDAKAQLRAAGVPIPEGPLLLEDAYAYGTLLASLLLPTIAEETPEQVRTRIEAHPLPPTPIEEAAQSYAANHAAQYVTGLGNRVAADVAGFIIEQEDQLQPDDIRRLISDETEMGIARRDATERIKSNMGHSIQNWTRDWLRIATTEVNNAVQGGSAAEIDRQHGPHALVSKIPRPDACADCKALYLNDDGNPKVFRLSELRANGTNVGRHRKAWLPTIEATHPWCACMLVFVPASTAWVDGELSAAPEREAIETDPDDEQGHMRDAAIVEGVNAYIAKKSEGDPKPLFLGPRGGKWANAAHTESWKPEGDPKRQLMLPLPTDEDRSEAAADAEASGVKLSHYFASGSNHAGEIEGFASLGWNVGVAAPDLNHSGEMALYALRGKGTKVFVDSGAFSEIGFNPAPYVKDPISDEEWDKRLNLYDRLAAVLGPQLYAVAPDKVAFQDDTFMRLEKYAPRIKALAAKGVNILVPLQKGKLSLADFDRKVEALLGIDYVRAIPMKKDATSTADFEAYLQERHPKRIHLLGLGEKNERFEDILAAVQRLSPETEVFLDSVKITSAVERPKLKASGGWSRPRRLTAAQDRVRLRAHARAFHTDEYTEAIGEPSGWLLGAERGKVASAAGLDPATAKRFIKDPNGFMQERQPNGDKWFAEPLLALALDRAWQDYYTEKGTTVERKRESIREVFGGKKLPHLKTREEAIQEAKAAENPVPAHRDAEHYHWETVHDAEADHRELVHHAVTSHEMTAKEYAKLHEKTYGPLPDFLKDPMRGEWASTPPVRKALKMPRLYLTSYTELRKDSSLFVGPRGGQWANPEHTRTHPDNPPDQVHGKRPKVDVAKLLQGNLGIPRLEMPQIIAALVPDFIEHLLLRGVVVSNESVPVHTLKATQNELKADKIQSEVDSGDLGHLCKPIIVSNDNYLLDGHHRWGARATLDPGALQNVVRVHLPIRELLAAAHDFDGVEYRKSEAWAQHLEDEGFTAAEVLAKAEGIFDSPRLPRRMLYLGNETSPRPEPGDSARSAGLDDMLGTSPEAKAKRRKRKRRRPQLSARDSALVAIFPRLEQDEQKTAADYAPQTLIQNREAYKNAKDVEGNILRIREAAEERRDNERGIVDAVRKLPKP